MTKIQRVTGKIFGGTATATGTDPQIGQFGSALAGTYVGTTDISTIQSLPAWGQGFIGAVTTDNQFPALPEVTGFGKVLSQQQCYLLQQGVPEWDSATTYYTGNFCAKNSVLYVSLTDENLNNDPEFDTTNWELYASGSGGSYIGQLVFSILPQTEAGLHLLDGTIIDGAGVYARFVDYIKNLYIDNPTASYFTDEADWQASFEQYGVCGKFVYNASANTVRLPKVTGILEGTIDATALGDLVEAGLPTLTADTSGLHKHRPITESYKIFNQGGGGGGARCWFQSGDQGWTSEAGEHTHTISDAQGIVGNSETVQPQTIKGYYYIVVATSTKTDIEVDIDNIVTDLNDKVDISNMVDAGSYIAGCAMPSNKYISLTLGADGATYTAPADGYVSLTMNLKTADTRFYLANYGNSGDTTTSKTGFLISGAAGVNLRQTIPVKEGDIFKIGYNDYNTADLKFIYAVGSESEV